MGKGASRGATAGQEHSFHQAQAGGVPGPRHPRAGCWEAGGDVCFLQVLPGRFPPRRTKKERKKKKRNIDGRCAEAGLASIQFRHCISCLPPLMQTSLGPRRNLHPPARPPGAPGEPDTWHGWARSAAAGGPGRTRQRCAATAPPRHPLVPPGAVSHGQRERTQRRASGQTSCPAPQLQEASWRGFPLSLLPGIGSTLLS